MQLESPIQILLVEDDHRLAGLTKKYLEGHNVRVTVASNGPDGLREAVQNAYDAVLLDLMLPGMDGMQVCRLIREQKDIPIIMITARGEEADRVMGLETGADDYMPKPFSPRELLARIRSVVRRARGRAGPSRERITVGDLILDPGALRAELNGSVLDLTAYEFALLYALAQRAGRVLSRDQLMVLAGGDTDMAFDRSIDVHISRLRKKLGDDPQQPSRIRTVRSVGYQYKLETPQ